EGENVCLFGYSVFFFQAEDGIRDFHVTGVQTCALPICGQGGGIINVSSIAARLGSSNEYVDYAATKGAIDTFTLGLAKEVIDEEIGRASCRERGWIREEAVAFIKKRRKTK